MADRIVKLGVVGLRRGLQVVSEIAGDENVQIRAICDKNPERLEEARRYFVEERGLKDVLCFEKLEDILASDIDAVYIATDATLHTPQAIQALNAGKHVISEIPAMDSVEEAKQLKAAVKAHPELKYMVGENCPLSNISFHA